MKKIIECIPNFSEGRDNRVIEKLAACAGSVPGVSLLDYSADESHNRSVFTLIGDETGIAQAAFAMAALAVETIDLTQQKGEHPRMGAVDVVPFVPLRGADMADCVSIARQVGRRIADTLAFPVFLYEEAAANPHRRNLADVRHGQFEGLTEKMRRPTPCSPDRSSPERLSSYATRAPKAGRGCERWSEL